MKVALYLRKSRADEEMEKQGQGETLSKHRKALLKFSKEHELTIIDIKEEIVSGESLLHRPKMLELLKEVECKLYEGVLVMDMQRLGRGDMQDQGLILKTFKNSNTKIITPQKTYDLNNDFDEEYSEFEAFMSRKELKMITRRMQSGRIRSVEDGNYIGTVPPFGYDIQYIGKARTLKPNKDAPLVKLIFQRYVCGLGAGIIADELNQLGYKSPKGMSFESTSIIFILKNLIYIGKVTWKKTESKKSLTEGKRRDVKTRAKENWIIAEGKHEAIIEEAVFYDVQEILKGRYHVPYQIKNGIANPFAGIIVCKICGSKMILRKHGEKPPQIMCTKKCGCSSSRFDYVENAILEGLAIYYNHLLLDLKPKPTENNIKTYINQINILHGELEILGTQKLKLFDLLEQGIYDNNTFLERLNNINQRKSSILLQIDNLKEIIEKEKHIKAISKKTMMVLDGYNNANITTKNKLLKSLLIKVEYKKIKPQRDDNFEIELFPKIFV